VTVTERSVTTRTCRHCWQPIIAAGVSGVPLWVHTATRLAGCAGGLPIAEPVSPVQPPVQGALFDLPPIRARIGGAR
jgi:hypothetical protein